MAAAHDRTAAPAAPADGEIARRIAAGDRDALVTLMRRNNQALFRAARSVLKDDAEAEDAVQEAWVHAVRTIGGFRAEARLTTWLVRIAVNAAIGRLRQRRRRAEVVWLQADAAPGDAATEADPMDPDSSERPDERAARAQLRRLLEARIDALPEAFRVVFVLRAVEEMSVDETAQCLGLPAATVRTRFFRARALLRESISRDLDAGTAEAFSFAGERCDRIVAGVLARLEAPGNPRA